jgi:beta-lactam-binding protein with PASTA domain
MQRILRILRDVLILLVVALVSTLITMRLAIHGSEVAVPDLTNLATPEAAARAHELRLNLSVEARYFSATIPAGHLLAQSPPAGTHVRRDWTIRVTESLGPQLVTIPSLLGQPERDAAINLQRAGLTLGDVAHLPAADNQPPDPAAEVVIAQSPPPAAGADTPRVSILLGPNPSAAPSSVQIAAAPAQTPLSTTKPPHPATSQPQKSPQTTTVDATNSTLKNTIAMPKLVGLPVSQALKILHDSSLHIAAVEDVPIAPTPPAPIGASAQIAKPAAPASLPGTVIKQSPPAGSQVAPNADVHLSVAR